MSKVLSLLLLALFATGCATVQSKPHESFRSWGDLSTSDKKLELYRAYYVSMEQPSYPKIDGVLYSPLAMVAYYENSGVSESAQLQLKAIKQNANGTKFFHGMVQGTALTGALGALLITRSNPQAMYEKLEVYGYILGWAVGAVLGLIPGSLGAQIQNQKADKAQAEAADIFNAKLLKGIGLDVRPEPGGAKAGAKLKF